MTTVANPAVSGNLHFQSVLEPFLQQPGLPFAEVLSPQVVQQAFARRDALFATDAVFSTPVVLSAFLGQVLQDGKQAACAAAIANIATYLQQVGGTPPSGDTGDYCRARAKLNLDALRDLTQQVATELDQRSPQEWLWQGRHAKLVDGFTFTMPDTPDNQAVFPQQENQAPGVGLPIARAVAVLSLGTAAIHDIAVGPYQGKETGETALFRGIQGCLNPGDVAIADRHYGSYLLLARQKSRGVDVCTRMNQGRKYDMTQGEQLGDRDHLATWKRPERPDWMSPEDYSRVPLTLTVRELQFEVIGPDQKIETITLVTTLTDPVAYPKEAIMELYGLRWNVELDILQIKQTLNLDHVRCKSPEMVRRELWVTLLGYNLIRKVIATAAMRHGKQPRRLGHTLACQEILSSWTLLATGAVRNVDALIGSMLARIAANEVADRPGRHEPRVIKRRRHRYSLMTKSRAELRAEMAKS